MASRFSIYAQFSAVDKMTRPIKKMAQSNSRFTKQIRKDYALASRSANRFTNSLGKKGNAAMKRTVQVGLAGLGVGLAMAAKEYATFDDAIFGATARFKAAEKPGTDMTVVMKNLRKAARDMGAQTQFSATLMAQGLDKFALAGFNSEESIKVLNSQVNLATVTGEDFMQVADMSSDLLGSFGFAALES